MLSTRPEERSRPTPEINTRSGGVQFINPRFPNNPNFLFSQSDPGVQRIDLPNGNIRWNIKAGNESYRIEYHNQHTSGDHYDGGHYHVYRTSPGRNYRLRNYDPDSRAERNSGVFAPNDLLPTLNRSR